MMTLIEPAGHFQTQFLADGSAIYHYNNSLPSDLASFADATDPARWRHHFQPFACAIVNPHSREVVLVRDHLGVAPLYYCRHPTKKLFFAETIPDLLKLLPTAPPLLENQVALLFTEANYYCDETLYQGVYRVEPGHLMHFAPDGTVQKKAFWQLERFGETLHYSNDQDYLDHFSALMAEAIQNATQHQQNVAAEFSAGLDSSAVYCAATSVNVSPKLFMHTALPETESAAIYNDSYERAFIDHFQLTDIQRVGVDDFDAVQAFKTHGVWFAGPAPYLFFMFAHNVHRAVATGKHPILLSGFGGDQGVSDHIPLSFLVPDLIHQRKYQQAWLEIGARHRAKKAWLYLQYMHPALHRLAAKIRAIDQPYSHYYRSVREGEWFFLQGPGSHEVRMRIEYSSVASKQMGFEYRYPLLYPKLLEFFLSLPVAQKRRHGLGRYLIRRYLAEQIPETIFAGYKKREGLGIVPATFELFKQQFEQGVYKDEFTDLPYQHLVTGQREDLRIRYSIKAFMMHCVERGNVMT